MANLRWILLLAGLAFLAVLAAWEMRRPRHGRRETLSASGRSEPDVGQINDLESAASVPVLHAAYHNVRTPVSEPAQVELASYARYDEYASHDNIPPLEPPLVISLDGPPLQPIEPQAEHQTEYRAEYEPDGAEALCEQPQPHSEPLHSELGHSELGHSEPSMSALPDEVAQIVLPAVQPLTPIVEWPPEEQRHILSIRVVGLSPDRLSGRPLRQALSACGFVHGRFGIFHQPGADGRALISAANLSKPGVFDPTSMDLAQRLQARLQDEHGQPLDEERLEAMARTVHEMSNSALRTEPAA